MRKTFMSCVVLLVTTTFVFLRCSYTASAQEVDSGDEISDITEMSIEELMNIEVTSVSKKKEKLSESSAAVFVITQEDIRRSSAKTIPELLRMVPGLHVARINAQAWAISVRGFNGEFANKLLVLMDGRSLYVPHFSGVYWQLQDFVLDDIERIEVIRGPGASVWGANAVNGVINIITQNSRDTQGGLLNTLIGNEEKMISSIRYGGQLDVSTWYRIYAKYSLRDNSVFRHDGSAEDSGDMFQGGFRFDIDITERDSMTLQGDSYDHDSATTEQIPMPIPPFSRTFKDRVEACGSNLLWRWNRVISETSSSTLQFYYDRLDITNDILPIVHDTIDLDFQHRVMLGSRHDFIWGVGYRTIREDVDNAIFTIQPESRRDNLLSAFVQDDITLVEKLLELTIGSKFEDNDYTGFEIQPTMRILWKPHKHHNVWAAISRAARTPSTMEVDGRVTYVVPVGNFDVPITAFGDDDYKSEYIDAYEVGYRMFPMKNLSLDFATFYNAYDNLRSLETVSLFPSIVLLSDNKMKGYTYGAEVAADCMLLNWWRLRGAYSYLQMHLEPDSDSGDIFSEGTEDLSPHHQAHLWSSMDITNDIEIDAGIRHVDRLPAIDVGSYTSFDLRLEWRPVKDLEISIAGQNLLRNTHTEFDPEFGIGMPSKVERSVYLQLRWRF